MSRHRITVSHLLIVLVLLGVAAVASQVAARPDDGSARSATTIYQENNAKLAYSSPWKAVRTSKCMGGCMRTRSAAGSVTATFTGTGVSVFVTKGRAYGIMKVTLDGVSRKVSLYASSTAYKRKAYSRTGLADGPHTLTLAWTGKKVAAAKAKTVNLDAISIQGKLTQGRRRRRRPSRPPCCRARRTRRPTRDCGISAPGRAPATRASQAARRRP